MVFPLAQKMLFISKNYKDYVNSNFLDKSLDAKSISILDLEASFQNAFGGALKILMIRQ